jgi:hypothetical protein
MGVAVGAIQSDMTAGERMPVYACDIVYGTNNEFGFDYLRDNMKARVEDQVQRFLAYAIVDEVDSILIDEARTPLIISGPAQDSSDKYALADSVARALETRRALRGQGEGAHRVAARGRHRGGRALSACRPSSAAATRTGRTSSRTRCARTTCTRRTRSTSSRATR